MVTNGVILFWFPTAPCNTIACKQQMIGEKEHKATQSNIKSCLYRVWCPHCYPKSDIGQSYFCNSNFSALSILVGVRTERCYIHFLRLISQCLFVVDDSINDVIVTEWDDQKRGAIIRGEQTASVRNSLNKDVYGEKYFLMIFFIRPIQLILLTLSSRVK